MINVVFADGSLWPVLTNVPPLEVGGKARIKTPAIHTAILGHTVLRLDRGDNTWFTLYSYRVRGEEAWVLGLISTLILFGGAAIGGAAALLSR
jgi:hypothetical protein